MKFVLTAEQQRFVDHVPEPGSRTVVRAGPGAGKTTTCRLWAANVAGAHGRRVLLLYYNRRAVEEVQAAYADDAMIDVMTFDSLVAKHFRERGRAVQLADDLARVEGLDARLVKQVERFCNSAPAEADPAAELSPDALALLRGAEAGTQPLLLPVARRMFAAAAPPLPYEVVAHDESQDMNMPAYEALEAQIAHGRALVFCGDPRQQIYGFNGCVELESVLQRAGRPYTVMSLSFTQRFGPEIARLARNITFSREPLRPAPGRRSRVSFYDAKTVCPVPAEVCPCKVGEFGEAGFAILARTNAMLVGLVAGFADCNCNARLALAQEAAVDEVIAELGAYRGDSAAWRARYNEVRRAGFGVPLSMRVAEALVAQRLADRGRQRLARGEGRQITVTTIHGCKGSEFENVVLAGDVRFNERMKREDANLYFVGVTRAIGHLQVDESFRAALAQRRLDQFFG